MSRHLPCVIPFFALLGAALPTLAADEQGPPRENKLRVLVVTGGHDFERDAFFEVFNGHPDITWQEAVQPEAQAWFAPDKAGGYDVMVWYDMYQDISEEAKKNLVNLLEQGKPLVVLHHALANYNEWPEAIRIIGGRYPLKSREGYTDATFKHDVNFRVKIADPSHPITRFMTDFDILDETYNHIQVLPSVKPLLTVEHETSWPVVGWTHTYGRSPVAYIQLGHDSKAYTNPNYRRLVIQAIRWAAGRLPDPSDEGFVPLFNGRNLDGWKVMGNPDGFYVTPEGVLRSDSGTGGDWMRTLEEYDDFILKVEWRVGREGNSGVFIRAAEEGYPWVTGSEVQISNQHRDLAHCTGSLYGTVPANPRPDEAADVWHEFHIECRGPLIRVFADNIPVVDVDARRVPALGAKPLRGYIGLQDSHLPDSYVEFRKVAIKELKMEKDTAQAPVWKLGTQAYTFRLFSFFEAVDKAKILGLRYIEAYPGQRLSPDQPDVRFDHNISPELQDRVRNKLEESGVTLINYGVVGLGTDEAEARKVFDFAKAMGIETVVSEPDPAGLDMIERLTEEYGINLAIHNHPKPSRYWNPQTVLDAVKDRGPRVGACADTGHWARSGLDPVEALRKLEGRIISLHFKDLNRMGGGAHDVPWGKGVCNVEGMLTELHRQGFSGVFSVEYEHNWENNMPEIDESVRYFRAVAAELGQKHE